MQVNPNEVPNMESEIQDVIEWMMQEGAENVIDSIAEFYEGYEDLAVDCFKHLSAVSDKMNQAIDSKLKEMGRCTRCGTKLIVCQHNEVHDELDGCPIEIVYDKFCPECDVPYIIGEEVME